MRLNMLFIFIVSMLAFSCSQRKFTGKETQNSQAQIGLTKSDLITYQSHEFLALSKRMRLEILESFSLKLELEYVGLIVKKNSIQIDFEKIKKESLNIESEIEDFDELELQSSNLVSEFMDREDARRFLLAKRNLDFYDRIKKILAQFQDSHLTLTMNNELAYIFLPFKFKKIGDKYYISGIDGFIINQYLSENKIPDLKFKIGMELTHINGLKVADYLAREITPFVGLSSSNATETRSLERLSIRNFKFPKDPNLKLTFKDQESIKIPYRYIFSIIDRLDQFLYFKTLGYSEYPLNNSVNNKMISTIRYSDFGNLSLSSHIAWKKIITNKDNDELMKLGIFIINQKAYGIISFSKFDRELNDKLPEVVQFLNYLNKQNIPLVIDLIDNVGGSLDTNNKLIGLFIKKDLALYQQTVTSPSMLEIYTTEYIIKATPNPIDPQQNITQHLKDSTILAKNIFKQQIVILTSELCVSACEIFTRILSKNSNALLMGSTLSGTGLGFTSRNKSNSNWIDPYNLFNLKIPNMLFYSTLDDLPNGPGSFEIKNYENKPFVPPYFYRTTLYDLENESLGWLERAAELINK